MRESKLRARSQQVAGAIERWLRRPADLAARFGGEEFTAILPMTVAAGAQVLAEHIRRAVAQLGIAHSGSSVCSYLTVSVGGAAIVPPRDSSVTSLVEAADGALYQAKRSGKNRVVMAEL